MVQPIYPHNEFLLHYLLCRDTFLSCEKQFCNYDKYQPIIFCRMRLCYSFHYVCWPTHNYLPARYFPHSGANETQQRKWASHSITRIHIWRDIVRQSWDIFFARKTAIDGDDDECRSCGVRGNAKNMRRWSGANETPFSLLWYGKAPSITLSTCLSV